MSFNRDIRPILSANCFFCHGPDANHREADLRLDQADAAHAERAGAVPFKPHDLAGSAAWMRINAAADDERMPPPDSHRKLTAAQIALVKRWIEEGATYEGHWSFQPLEKPAPPAVHDASGVRNPIDQFTMRRLEQDGLQLSPEADRPTLIRRVTFDLTGLPPTLDEVDAFVHDADERAYERVVDRLLASPRFGERMAVAWLDAARYGDSSGLHADGERQMWAWRDWVIHALNDNMPFDRFTVEQLAGDLLPDATPEQRVASAFNRNHCTSDEGGAIDEELRVQYVVDRVQTTAAIWLGLTMECGQCHDQKYDPISQKEYYRFFAYFNQSTDGGLQMREGNASPVFEVPRPVSESTLAPERQQLTRLEQQIDSQLAGISAAEFAAWQQAQSAANGGAPLPQNPLLYFPLDESAENDITDMVAPDRRCTIEGKALRTAGQIAGALAFDGQNSAVLGDVANVERTDPFSVVVWVNAVASTNGTILARMDHEHGGRGYELAIRDGRIVVRLVHAWPDNAIEVSTATILQSGIWQNVIVAYDGSSTAAGIKIYFGGVEQTAIASHDALRDSIRTGVPLQLGHGGGESQFRGSLDEVRCYGRQLDPNETVALAGAGAAQSILAIPPERRTSVQLGALRKIYLEAENEAFRKLTAATTAERLRVAEIDKALTSVMVMQEMQSPRPTYVLKRGDYASPARDEVIPPGLPAVLPQPRPEAPANRLGLAQWLIDPRQPLTARVAVNRYWQMLFGAGIVTTVEDFGAQGAWPSHPELLDWLAADFVEHGWDVKRAIKQMATSATYRQSARISPELWAKDSENRLLARGPRFRLQAEFVRDQALAISGLLVDRIGGPSVKPYEPEGLWEEVGLPGGPKFMPDHGPNLYRRSLYTYWKRSSPAPSMRLFDAPTREKCTIQRQRTNTPLQALVTLNDPQFVEAARMLAERTITAGGESPAERIRFAYRLATARAPDAPTLAVLLNVYECELEVFRGDAGRAERLLGVGDSPRNERLDASEHAAWTIVASMILNLDETITRG